MLPRQHACPFWTTYQIVHGFHLTSAHILMLQHAYYFFKRFLAYLAVFLWFLSLVTWGVTNRDVLLLSTLWCLALPLQKHKWQINELWCRSLLYIFKTAWHAHCLESSTKIRIASLGMAQDIFEVSIGGRYRNESAYLETSSSRCHQKQKRRICFFVASTANIDLLRSIWSP